jgi:hypothetical protein
MKKRRFELFLGIFFVVLFSIFFFWHSPIKGKLNSEEINGFLDAIGKAPFPPDQKAETLARLRAWAEADDGKPVFMVNLIRNYDQILHYPGSPDFNGTPADSNAYYEKKAIPMLLKSCSYPSVVGRAQGGNVLGFDPALDNWSEVMVVRYRNRKAFLSLLSDPAYAPIMPYKLMASQVYLAPVFGDIVVPDLRWVVGGSLLIVFLLVGWIRSEKRNRNIRKTGKGRNNGKRKK